MNFDKIKNAKKIIDNVILKAKTDGKSAICIFNSEVTSLSGEEKHYITMKYLIKGFNMEFKEEEDFCHHYRDSEWLEISWKDN